MALYGYTCPACGTTAEVFRGLEQRNHPVLCPFCADLNHVVRMRRERSLPALRGATVART